MSNFDLSLTIVRVMQGRVKWFDNRRGYGFITGEDGHDVYVYYTALQGDGFRSLKHNWRVTFDVVTTDEGRVEARNVVVIPK
jgi:CspA family cold shock protein